MLVNYHSNDAVKETIREKALVVALFSDLECNVCLAITPELEALSEKYSRADFVTADVEVIKSLVGDYMVFVYPTIIIFAEGRETKRFERVFSMDDIEASIDRYYSLIFE